MRDPESVLQNGIRHGATAKRDRRQRDILPAGANAAGHAERIRHAVKPFASGRCAARARPLGASRGGAAARSGANRGKNSCRHCTSPVGGRSPRQGSRAQTRHSGPTQASSRRDAIRNATRSIPFDSQFPRSKPSTLQGGSVGSRI
jgi:hypothetical protein